MPVDAARQGYMNIYYLTSFKSKVTQSSYKYYLVSSLKETFDSLYAVFMKRFKVHT